MVFGKFDPQRFFQSVDSVALHVPAEELFGFLKRTFDLPPSWAALVKRTTGDHVLIPAGDQVPGEDVEDVLFARVTPVDLVLDDEEVVTRDHFRCRAKVQLRVSLVEQRGELSSFKREVLGSHRAVTSGRLADSFKPGIRGALSQFASEHDADEFVGSRCSAPLAQAVTKAIEAVCFAAGLVLDRVPTIELSSGTFNQVQEAREEASRRRQTHEAKDQVRRALMRAQEQRFDHLSSLLTRLDALADGSPDVTLSDLMRTFSQQQRGELYEALFASQTPSAATRWIVVAAGDELMFFDPQDLAVPVRRVPIGGSAGPVRSVQIARGEDGRLVLFLGAATGVYKMPVDQNEPDLTFTVGGESQPRGGFNRLLPQYPSTTVGGESQPRGGFNGVALAGRAVIASHSELGLFRWDLEQPTAGQSLFPSLTGSAKAVRHAQFFDGRVYASVDNRVIRWPADALTERDVEFYTGSGSTITALSATNEGLFAGNSDGDVLHWATDHPSAPQRLHMGTGRPAESVWVVDTGGVPRLWYVDTSLHVYARVVGDSFCCRYEAGGQTLRRVEVAPDLIVATNDLRDRLILWSPDQPEKPMATIVVSAIAGHSIQDAALVVGA